MPLHEYVTLNTGAKMPTVGLGTMRSKKGEEVAPAVEYALKEAGYRHLDTAKIYDNEVEVGEGIKASGVPRSEIFLTTKLWNSDQADPEKALNESLKRLGTDYVDLYLLHWPAPTDKSIDWVDTWTKMEEMYEKNKDKVRAIGVSNIGVNYFDRLLKKAKVIPAVNQIELHPSCVQEELVEFCRQKGIVVTSYCPLGQGNASVLDEPVVAKIAKKHGVEPGQILISFQANRPGVTVIPKSTKPKRIASNFKVVDLSEEEMKELADIDKTKHFRVCTPFWAGHGNLGWDDCKEE